MSLFHVFSLKKCLKIFMTMSRFTLLFPLMTLNVFLKNTAFFSFFISVQMSSVFHLIQLRSFGICTFLGQKSIETFVKEFLQIWFFQKFIHGTNQVLTRWKETINELSSFIKLLVIKNPIQEFGDFLEELKPKWNLGIWTYFDSATLEWVSA